jgi:hypothetical protein
MDPLSIVASIASVLQFGVSVSTGLGALISTWKNASPAIYALYNEVSDLNVVLDHAHRCQETVALSATPLNAKFLASLSDQLTQARQILGKMEELVNQLVQLGGWKKRWKWLAKTNKATELKYRLRSVRIRINELLVAYNV